MRYRDSDEKPDLINPEQVYKITVDLWATANTFQKGHIIRLEVSSSNFPRIDRNLNTGADQATSKEFVSATNTVLHDADHPSALILPVMPAAAIAQISSELDWRFLDLEFVIATCASWPEFLLGGLINDAPHSSFSVRSPR
jgi:hypothetical protein